jgi:GNAT superfamily N-acetyltransferase
MIHPARVDDLDAIVALAALRRVDQQVAQPQFWRPALDATERHAQWLRGLVADDAVVSLAAVDAEGTLVGYVFATLVAAPPVYDPGGSTGFIDDFAVSDASLWATVGVDLLAAARQQLAERGAVQIVVVSGHHDAAKRSALRAAGLALASEWYVGPSRADVPSDRHRPGVRRPRQSAP